MKKLLFLSVCVALLASCGNAGKNEALKAEMILLQQLWQAVMQNWTKSWPYSMMCKKDSA